MADDPRSGEEAGFEIKDPRAERGRFYPWPTSFRLGDTVLVEKVTGLPWIEFNDRLPDDDDPPETDVDGGADLVVLSGLMAVAIWQQHPQWRRERVVRYVETLPIEKLVFHGGDDGPDDEEEPDARPPDEAGPTSSESSPRSSSPEPGADSERPSPSSSGQPQSDGSPASDPQT